MNLHTCLILGLALALASCQPKGSSPLPGDLSFHIRVKEAGNPSRAIELTTGQNGVNPVLEAEKDIPLVITPRYEDGEGGCSTLHLHIRATAPVNFHLRGSYSINDADPGTARFLLPGFWENKVLLEESGV